jgi:hypothetical protein
VVVVVVVVVRLVPLPSKALIAEAQMSAHSALRNTLWQIKKNKKKNTSDHRPTGLIFRFCCCGFLSVF